MEKIEKGYLYIAYGEAFTKEALMSIQSLRRFTKLPIALYTDQAIEKEYAENVGINLVGNIKANHLRAKVDYMDQSPFLKTVFMDSDTVVVRNCDDMFDLLDRFDVAIVNDYARKRKKYSDIVPEYGEIPYAFSEANSGVIAFNDSTRTQTFLKMWKEYFPNAKIYGLDIDPNCLKYEDERTKIFICDQNNEKDLKNVNEKLKNIDIILDDGSHKYEHMIKSFSFLFSCLKKDGFYVVEDIINNYKVLNFFTRYVYGINYFPTNTATVTEPGYDKINLKNAEDIKNTVAIHFYRHILFLQRGFNPEDNPYKNITEKQIIY